MTNAQEPNPVAHSVGQWRGGFSLALGLLAIFFFVVRTWTVAALGDRAEAAFHLAVTWLPVILPMFGFRFGIFGIAKDRQKGWAIARITVNALGLVVVGVIIAILLG